jgi:primosomal replication protein N
MKKPKLEKFGLAAIQTILSNSDIETARKSLAFAVGAVVDVSGIVQKVVKRNDQCKLLILPDDAQLTIFADCRTDEKAVISRKIRKGSSVRVKGKLLTFGASAVCLSDCRLKL